MSRKAKADITKQFIIDQLTDNEVDLSMNELTTVPVKELVNTTILMHYFDEQIFRLLLLEGQDWTYLEIT